VVSFSYIHHAIQGAPSLSLRSSRFLCTENFIFTRRVTSIYYSNCHSINYKSLLLIYSVFASSKIPTPAADLDFSESKPPHARTGYTLYPLGCRASFSRLFLDLAGPLLRGDLLLRIELIFRVIRWPPPMPEVHIGFDFVPHELNQENAQAERAEHV
jgi:hypothetical protein